MIVAVSIAMTKPTTYQEGVVKYYNEEKGFGYITASEDEVFVYEENIIDEIKAGDKVSFDKRNTRKGYEAINVRLLNK